MANEIYNKMAKALNSEFIEEDAIEKLKQNVVTEVVEVAKEVMPTTENLPATQPESNNEVVPYEKPKGPVFTEQEFVKDELHDTINEVQDVMDILKSDLRQGSRASLFDAYSNLAKTKLSAINDLSSYDKDVKHEERFEDVDKDSSGETATAQQNITLNLNGADMLDKILEYKNRQVDQADAEVVEEDDQ